MNHLPESKLVLIPGGTLITNTPTEGRELAMTMARHTIHNIQPDLDILKQGRQTYAKDPDSMTAASQVVAIEFQAVISGIN